MMLMNAHLGLMNVMRMQFVEIPTCPIPVNAKLDFQEMVSNAQVSTFTGCFEGPILHTYGDGMRNGSTYS
jgi:hypothetical protein